MQVMSANNNFSYSNLPYSSNTVFCHDNRCDNYAYNKKQKALIAATSALGVMTSLAAMAKHQGYSLKPSKLFKDFKHSYILNANFDGWKPIVAMGAGSILGGFVGGCVIDKNEQNRKAKAREAFLQIGNISIPILVVDKIAVNGLCKNSKPIVKAIVGLIGLFAGVGIANIIMNKLNNFIFNNKDERGIKLSDFSAHIDDLLAASGCIFKNNDVVHKLGRIIPIALIVPGYETGKKQSM